MDRPDSFAAHIKEEQIQTVQTHCENVADYAAQEADKMGLSNTMRLTGLLHDVGKAKKEFNDYIHKTVLHSSDVKHVNHSSAGARYLYETVDCFSSIDEITCQLIAFAVVSHHGISDIVDLSGENCFSKRLYPEKNIFFEEAIENASFLDVKKIQGLFVKAVEEIKIFFCQIKDLFQEMGASALGAGEFMLGSLQRLILSFLVDADWRDTSEFMNDIKYERLSGDAIIKKWDQYQKSLNRYIEIFRQDSILAEARKAISEECYSFAQNGNGIYRLAIPTGGGKTLSSIRYALELAQKEKKNHIFYIAPYLSILEQNAQLIKTILRDTEYVIEFHSNIIRKDDERGNQLSEDWSELVILTTLVQFLNAMFSGNMKSIRRFHQLTNSIIIIDEAQAIPIKCLGLFTTMTNFLSRCCHTTIVICTATQPLFEKIDYRLLYSKPADMILDIIKYKKPFTRTEIINMADHRMKTDELATMVLKIFKKNILIILNTKLAVQKLYEELKSRAEENILIFQLTTYMCAAHRLDVIERIKQLLQKSDQKVICVSTQLVEAGVDISFETVIRSLTGLDSIAQAAGRCNRNAEENLGKVYIVDYADENISKLKDIRCAQDAMRHVIDRFSQDLFSQEAMAFYYKQYFFSRKDEMLYPIREENDTVYNLLAKNDKNRPVSYPYPMSQAFRRAGEYFQVIEEKDTVSLIVPYKSAKEYIQQLRSAETTNEVKSILKKLQRYTVNVYREDKKLNILIGRRAVDCSLLDGNVCIVDKAFYDDNGLKENLELLTF